MTEFRSHPSPAEWDDYVDFESKSWPKKERPHYWIIPSICFNCESACGILAYVDKERLTVCKIEGKTVRACGILAYADKERLAVRKPEGNPVHRARRGRTCAKGVVPSTRVWHPDRML